ncbi:MAG: Mrp/NBP35 family ATP-binding protein [Dehalococcoidia bacterium]
MDIEKIEQALGEIKLSQPKRSITQLNMVRDIKLSLGKVNIKLSLNALPPQESESIQAAIRTAVTSLDGIKEVSIELMDARPIELNRFGHVIAIMSGKGGVGKSLVTGLTAIALKREGYDVGILDADITGPSIPKMFGIKDRPGGTEGGILTVESSFGIQIMSLNLLLPNEDDAVIWRGPILAKVITQFWQDVLWGRLDYLLVDLPPGTADIPLTVLQSLPLSGVLIVSTPQDLSNMVVRKAVKMARKMNIPIIGVIENMSYLITPDTGKKIDIFGKSRADEMAQAAEAPLLGRIPLDPELAALCDSGLIEHYRSKQFAALAHEITKHLKDAPPPAQKDKI